MMQIKTVVAPITQANSFDEQINLLLKNGWILKTRKLINAHGEPSDAFCFPVVQLFYAELEIKKEIYPEEITL